jgi:hypothetical protein
MRTAKSVSRSRPVGFWQGRAVTCHSGGDIQTPRDSSPDQAEQSACSRQFALQVPFGKRDLLFSAYFVHDCALFRHSKGWDAPISCQQREELTQKLRELSDVRHLPEIPAVLARELPNRLPVRFSIARWLVARPVDGAARDLA